MKRSVFPASLPASVPFAAVLLGLAAQQALGTTFHNEDILLRVNNNAVEVGVGETGVGIFPGYVFTDTFGKLGPSLPNRTPDPGINAIEGQFVGNSEVTLRLTRAARVWNGTDFCDISPIPLEVRKFGEPTIVTPDQDPATPDAGPGIVFGFSSPQGQLHEHGGFWLTDPFTDGVYLLEARIEVSSPSIAPSEPFYIVFDQNAPSDLPVAAQWMADTIDAGGSLDDCAPCTADFNQDTVFSVGDILDFLAAWAGQTDPRADINNDTVYSVGDILDFLALWSSSCA